MVWVEMSKCSVVARSGSKPITADTPSRAKKENYCPMLFRSMAASQLRLDDFTNILMCNPVETRYVCVRACVCNV